MRKTPYRYTCTECGGFDIGENARGPMRTRCRGCMWGRKGIFRTRFTAIDAKRWTRLGGGHKPRPPVPSKCRGCGAKINQDRGRGRPRAYCTGCRPGKPGDRNAAARVIAERGAWKARNPVAIKPSMMTRRRDRRKVAP